MTVDIVTFGCRLNACESEVMRRAAQAAGVTDTVGVNTCAVTAEAVRQSRQTVRRIKRERPDVRIVVTGCAAQIEPQSFADMNEADYVIGNAEKKAASTFAGIASGAKNPEGAVQFLEWFTSGETKLEFARKYGGAAVTGTALHDPEAVKNHR